MREPREVKGWVGRGLDATHAGPARGSTSGRSSRPSPSPRALLLLPVSVPLRVRTLWPPVILAYLDALLLLELEDGAEDVEPMPKRRHAEVDERLVVERA